MSSIYNRCGLSLSRLYGIRNIPTILFFKGGELVSKLVGAQSKAKLQEEALKLLD